jgi:glycosyltransferase involved in cell wall biosynthesis
VRHRCRGSYAEGVAYAAGLARQQPRLLEHADALVAVSEGLAVRLGLLGLPLERMTVVRNAVRAFAEVSHAGEGTYALAAGRLVEEKGFDIAIRVARDAGVPLRIAGAGPEEPRLRDLAAGADVTFLGRLSGEQLARERRGAAMLLAPARSDDPCPMAVIEAMADGLPVLASDRGGLPELVGDGAALPLDDEVPWRAALTALWSDPAARAAGGAAALARARERHAPDVWYEQLMQVYGNSGHLCRHGRHG